MKRWTPFVEHPVLRDGFLTRHLTDEQFQRMTTNERYFVNSQYQVRVTFFESAIGPMAELAIKAHDGLAKHDWRDLQRIKNELLSPEVEAVELYPAEARLVDTSNAYFLYAMLDPLQWFPFGFRERLVSEGSEFGVSQRAWERDQRPADVTAITFTHLQHALKKHYTNLDNATA